MPQAVLDRPGFVPAAPLLEEIDRFDAAFFGISPGKPRRWRPPSGCSWSAAGKLSRMPGVCPAARWACMPAPT
ncbi:hypothetical protein ACFQU7_36520 [Pseudoroseomonas wenyumeiae]